MRYILNIFLLFAITFSAFAQKEVVMSQYMYNKYSINPAFGGSHEVLSAYGSYRKQWLGFDKSPSGSFFTVHAPLKNDKVALGLQIYNESYAVTSNTGFSLSYTYRLFLNNKKILSFGISGGMINYNSNWSDVVYADYTEAYAVDNIFESAEQKSMPWIGFGTALYSDSYFVGFSVPNIMHYDSYDTNSNNVDFASIDYLLTAGYKYVVSQQFAVQPSFLLRVNPNDETFVDVSATAIYKDSFFIGATYRTTSQMVAIVGCNINQQLRCTYSLDYNLGGLGTYNNGTHEVSLQYDFGFKIKTANPKYF